MRLRGSGSGRERKFLHNNVDYGLLDRSIKERRCLQITNGDDFCCIDFGYNDLQPCGLTSSSILLVPVRSCPGFF